MGFFDLFKGDDPNALAYLLGTTGGAGKMPQPPQDPVGGSGSTDMAGSEPQFIRPPPQMPPTGPAGMAPMRPPMGQPNAVNASEGGPSMNWAGGGVPRPSVDLTGPPALPPGQAAPGPQGPPPATSLAPPNPNSQDRVPVSLDMSGGQRQPPPNNMLQTGFLQSPMARQLGINISPDRARQIQSAIAGGLSNYKPGQSPFQAAMGGVGGSLKGGEEQARWNTEDERKGEKQNFDQLNAAHRNLWLAKSTQSTILANEARADLFQQKAKNLESLGTGGQSSSWRNQPWGRVYMAEQNVIKTFAPRYKSIDEAVKSGVMSPSTAQAEREKIKADEGSFRDQHYKSMGIDRATAEKEHSRGLTRENPFDGDKMSIQEFNAMVPKAEWKNGKWEGGWYKWKGKYLQRTKGPDEAGQPLQHEQRQQQERQRQIQANSPTATEEAQAPLAPPQQEEGAEA